MNRTLRSLTVLSLAAGALTAAPQAANAYVPCSGGTCYGLDPIQMRCTDGYDVWDGNYGAEYIELVYSPKCNANWARTVTPAGTRFWVDSDRVQAYTSVPNLASWTNMVDGTPPAEACVVIPPDNFGDNVFCVTDRYTSYAIYDRNIP